MKTQWLLAGVVMTGLLLCYSVSSADNSTSNLMGEDALPTIDKGARVFAERCTTCHGTQGMGEGAIALKIEGYPDTNLVSVNKVKSRSGIQDVIVYGGLLPDINAYMPPFGDELSWSEIKSVSKFVFNLRRDPASHYKLISQYQNVFNDRNTGAEIFSQRCSLCHGDEGRGDGRMTKIINSPAPYNLTKSTAPLAYLKKIIKEGGGKNGRSPQMPPWGNQLSDEEIHAVAKYILTVRKKP